MKNLLHTMYATKIWGSNTKQRREYTLEITRRLCQKDKGALYHLQCVDVTKKIQDYIEKCSPKLGGNQETEE